MTSTTTPRRFGELAGELEPGAGDARPPLVFLHGLTFDRRMWAPALRELAELDPGRATLTLDLPGHGESVDAYRGKGALVPQVRAAVQAAGFERPVYVAHSAGIEPAAQLAAQGEARGVVNVDATLMVEPLFTMLASRRAEIYGAGFATVWADILAGLLADLRSADAAALVRTMSRPRQNVAIGYWSEVLEHGAETATAQVRAGVAAMRATKLPCLLVAGSEPDPAYAALLARDFPEAALAVLPDSGHFPHLAHPREFACLLATTAAWPEVSSVPDCVQDAS
jgi:pimeloyl-ACP methyl ester carboxylesterase